MRLSIGAFVEDEKSLLFVNEVGRDYPLHLGFFSFKDFFEYKDKITPNVKISSCHLPAVIKGHDQHDFNDLVAWYEDKMLENIFVLHPNKGIYDMVISFEREWGAYSLFCFENFPYKKRSNKVMRTPIEILARVGELNGVVRSNSPWNKYGFCLDTSHLNSAYFDPTILNPLIEQVDIMHLSDRTLENQHLPLGDGDLPIQFLLTRLQQKKINIEIVLEYTEDLKNKTIRDFEYLRKRFKVEN